MRKASFHTALLAVVLAGSLTAGDDPFQEVDAGAVKARLDAVANSYTTDNVFMGSILVADGDQVLLDKGYGMANLEWNIPNTPEANFGSHRLLSNLQRQSFSCFRMRES